MESCTEKSIETCLSKSPNKHNRLFMTAEPLNMELIEQIETQKIFPQQDVKLRAKVLVGEHGWDDDNARKIWSFGPIGKGPNLFVDTTKAVQ
mmetsp:Transcript_105580/g.227554  ORF Transcript_105580/g.227554 Transcript_105580/m.227554 type:complete len:92 (+) Transcript_105580:1666-1941(+)